MNDILRIARLRIALQRAFLGRAILRVIMLTLVIMMTMATMMTMTTALTISTMMTTIFSRKLEVVQCTHCRVDRSEWWIISQLLNTDQCRYRAARAASYESTKVQKSKIQKKCEFCSSPGVGRVYANCCRRERLNSELWIPPVRNLISPNALNANSFSTSRQRILIAGDPKHYIALQNLKLRRHDVFLGVSWWGF